MPECPACFGEGHHDLRDQDAWFAEHHTDEELAAWEELGFVRNAGIVPCGECEATGVVSNERRNEIMAHARESVERAMRFLDIVEEMES